VHAAHDLGHGTALLFHHGGDCGGDFVDAADRPCDRVGQTRGLIGRLLDAGDMCGDLLGRASGLPGKRLDLGGDDGKAPARLSRPRRFDGRIEGEQIGLGGDLVDEDDDVADALRRLLQPAHLPRAAFGIGAGRGGGGARVSHPARDFGNRRGYLLRCSGNGADVGVGLLGGGRHRPGEACRPVAAGFDLTGSLLHALGRVAHRRDRRLHLRLEGRNRRIHARLPRRPFGQHGILVDRYGDVHVEHDGGDDRARQVGTSRRAKPAGPQCEIEQGDEDEAVAADIPAWFEADAMVCLTDRAHTGDIGLVELSREQALPMLDLRPLQAVLLRPYEGCNFRKTGKVGVEIIENARQRRFDNRPEFLQGGSHIIVESQECDATGIVVISHRSRLI
jgi:hypothetical protein